MKTKVFLGSLPERFEKKLLLEYFEQYGEIKSLKVLKKGNRCTGCAILVCKTEDTRNIILNSQHKILGRLIECHEYRRGKNLKNYNKELWKRRVYIKGIPEYYQNTDLKEAFSKIGGIKIASISKKREDNPVYAKKKFYMGNSGFVTFLREEDAREAVKLRFYYYNGAKFVIFKCFSKEETDRFHQKQLEIGEKKPQKEEFVYEKKTDYLKREAQNKNCDQFEENLKNQKKIQNSHRKNIPNCHRKKKECYRIEVHQTNAEKKKKKKHPLAGYGFVFKQRDYEFTVEIFREDAMNVLRSVYLNHYFQNLRLN